PERLQCSTLWPKSDQRRNLIRSLQRKPSCTSKLTRTSSGQWTSWRAGTTGNSPGRLRRPCKSTCKSTVVGRRSLRISLHLQPFARYHPPTHRRTSAESCENAGRPALTRASGWPRWRGFLFLENTMIGPERRIVVWVQHFADRPYL